MCMMSEFCKVVQLFRDTSIAFESQILLVRTRRQTQNSSTNDGLDEVKDLIRDGRSASSLALLGTSFGCPGGSDFESCFRGTARISGTNLRRSRGRSDCTAPRSDASDADSLGGGTLEVEGSIDTTR